MPTYRAQLKIDEVSSSALQPTLRFTATITDQENIGTTALFVMRQRPASPSAEHNVNEFINVATIYDIVTYPEDEPDGMTEYPWFRVSTITLDFQTYSAYSAASVAIKERVQDLLNALTNADSMTTTYHEWLEGV